MKFSRKEGARLRELAGEAWQAELDEALLELHEDFGKWAEDGLSAFDLAERIHAFHDGISRELYKRYSLQKPSTAVAFALARGVLGAESVDPELMEKLRPLIPTLTDDNGE